MKHIVSFLLIILSLNSRAYSQEYNELFSDMDSVAKTEISNHVYKIIKMLNYEYNQINDSLLVEERVVLTTLKIDSENKLSVFKINAINTDITESLNQWFKKAPPLPLEDLKKGAEIIFITTKFDLKKRDYEGLKFDEIIAFQKDENNNKKINELDIYPSYGKKPQKFTTKEKSHENMDKTIRGFIIKNFKYPDYALDRNIQGKTETNFIINTNGEIRTIVSYLSHPVLQNEAVSIIENFPKFNPGIKDGKPVATNYQVPITFRLK